MWVSPAWHFQKQRNKFQSLDPQWEIQGGRKSKIDCLLHCILWDLGKKNKNKPLCIVKKKKNCFFNMAFIFLEETCMRTPSQRLLYTYDTAPMMSQLSASKTEPAAKRLPSALLGEESTGPPKGSRELGPVPALATNSVCDVGQFT